MRKLHSVCNQFKLIPILSQFASVMDRDQIAEAVMIKEIVLARRLILLEKSVINVIWNPIGSQTVKVGLTGNIVS
jgi:hypothetical protein